MSSETPIPPLTCLLIDERRFCNANASASPASPLPSSLPAQRIPWVASLYDALHTIQLSSWLNPQAVAGEWCVVQLSDGCVRVVGRSACAVVDDGERRSEEPILAGCGVVVLEERWHRAALMASPLFATSPPRRSALRVLLVTPHVRDAAFAPQAAFPAMLSHLRALGFSLTVIDALPADVRPPAGESAASWETELRANVNVSAVLRCRCDEAERAHSIVAAVQRSQPRRALLVLGDVALPADVHGDTGWLLAARKVVEPETAAKHAQANPAWHCPLLLSSAVRDCPEPRHVQVIPHMDRCRIARCCSESQRHC